jgi:hypothetical protein
MVSQQEEFHVTMETKCYDFFFFYPPRIALQPVQTPQSSFELCLNLYIHFVCNKQSNKVWKFVTVHSLQAG